MGFHIVVTGMVLSAIPIGEYDKRITILTKERGKITAFARGARRASNQMLAAANPFAFGQFEVYQGKSTYTVAKAEISNFFRDLAEDYETVCYGYYFLEMAEYYAQENTDEVERLKLLYQSLRALEKKQIPFPLIRKIYELKNMAINGEYPNVFACVKCGKEQQLNHFSMRLRGCICDDCVKAEGGNPLLPSTLYAIQFVISTPIEKLYSFQLSPQVLEEFIRLLQSYQQNYTNHRFKSEDFLC